MLRVGSENLRTRLMERLNENTSKWGRLQDQISSGQRAQRYSGLESLATRQIDLTAQTRQLDQYQVNNKLVTGRLNIQASSLDNVLKSVDAVMVAVSQAMSGGNANAGRVTDLASGAISAIGTSLNAAIGGVFVFAGTANDTKPVDTTDINRLRKPTPPEPTPDVPTYYSGSLNQPRAQIDDTLEMNYGLNAADQTFVDMFDALARVATSAGDTATLTAAFDDLSRVQSELADKQAITGAEQRLLNDVQGRQVELKLSIDLDIKQIEEVDLGQAMLELSQTGTIINASYDVISRLNQMSLLNAL
jgi:flagellar hook-associated protein 3 FlgL